VRSAPGFFFHFVAIPKIPIFEIAFPNVLKLGIC